MKKLVTLLLIAAIAVTAVACSSGNNSSSSSSSSVSSSASESSAPSSSAPAAMDSKALADVITGARDQDLNDAFTIVTTKDDDQAQLIFDMTGLKDEDMEAYAISISPMNTKAYGVALIKPAAGKEEAVVTALNTWVENQQKAFDQYLPDQKEIADAATVETLDNGIVMLIMSENDAPLREALTQGVNK